MTRRSLILGLLMASWVNLWPAYSSLVVDSSRADFSQLSIGLLVPFFILLGLNLLLSQDRGLSPSELLTICCMGMIAACMQGEWLSGYFLGVITAPTYFASAENHWAELIVSRLPEWTIVDAHATAGFYEGFAEYVFIYFLRTTKGLPELFCFLLRATNYEGGLGIN